MGLRKANRSWVGELVAYHHTSNSVLSRICSPQYFTFSSHLHVQVFFSSFAINISLGNFSFIQHHLFCCRTSLTFILWFPCWRDHLTRNLVIHWHSSRLTILPSIFWFCTPLFKAAFPSLPLPSQAHWFTLQTDSTFFNFFALLICWSFPLRSLKTVLFLFGNFSTFSIEKIIAFSSLSAFISKVA